MARESQANENDEAIGSAVADGLLERVPDSGETPEPVPLDEMDSVDDETIEAIKEMAGDSDDERDFTAWRDEG